MLLANCHSRTSPSDGCRALDLQGFRMASTILTEAPTTATLALRFPADEGGGLLPLRASTTTVGSGLRCDLRVSGIEIKPLHCVIHREAEGFVAHRWAESTLLNGKGFHRSTLQLGDELTLGRLRLQVVAAPAPVQEPQSWQEAPKAVGGAHGNQWASEPAATDTNSLRQVRAHLKARIRRLVGALRDSRRREQLIAREIAQLVEQVHASEQVAAAEQQAIRPLRDELTAAIGERDSAQRQLAELELQLLQVRDELATLANSSMPTADPSILELVPAAEPVSSPVPQDSFEQSFVVEVDAESELPSPGPMKEPTWNLASEPAESAPDNVGHDVSPAMVEREAEATIDWQLGPMPDSEPTGHVTQLGTGNETITFDWGVPSTPSSKSDTKSLWDIETTVSPASDVTPDTPWGSLTPGVDEPTAGSISETPAANSPAVEFDTPAAIVEVQNGDAPAETGEWSVRSATEPVGGAGIWTSVAETPDPITTVEPVDAIAEPILPTVQAGEPATVEESESSLPPADAPSSSVLNSLMQSASHVRSDDSAADGGSFYQRYAHLLEESDEAPEPQRPKISPAPATPSVMPEEEHSIEDYMAQMMERLRGTPEAKPFASTPVPSLDSAPSAVVTAPAPIAEVPPPAPVDPLMDLSELRRGARPTDSHNIGALRELANESTRSAIVVSQSRLHRERLLANVAVAAIAAACGGYLCATSSAPLSLQMAGGAIASITAVVWGGRTVASLFGLLVLRVPKRPSGPPALADDIE